MANKKSGFDITDLQHIGVLGFIGILFKIQWLKWFLVFYLLGFIRIIQHAKNTEENIPVSHIIAYYSSYFLSMLNPFVFVQTFSQIFGQLYILFQNRNGFPDKDNYKNETQYRLPFDGQWKVVNGGSTKKNSHSWDILTQRYAYDFVIHDDKDLAYKNEGKQLSDYYCYGKEILAPADGMVVYTKNAIKDYKGVGNKSLDWKMTDFRGNFIVIRHTENEFSFIAHIQKDSFYVWPGDKVKQGQLIARCGNTGHSTEPHIHFHLQNKKTMWTATGLPIQFSNIQKITKDNKKENLGSGFIEREERIENI